MKRKIVADSSANVHEINDCAIPFSSVPLKIVAGDKEYRDDKALNVRSMVDDLSHYKGKSGSSCPNAEDWISSFEDYDEIFGVSLTSGLSGCYNSGQIAASMYTEEHPGRKVFILDSLTTGPEEELIVEKYIELVNSDLSFEEIATAIKEYKNHTKLMFSLESLVNFVNNGRVNPAVAKAAMLLNICIVGQASDKGDLEPLHKCRGSKRAINQIFSDMKEQGFKGGKVRISHTFNEEGANKMAEIIKDAYPDCDVRIRTNNGLCSYYTENNGLLVGYELI